MDSEVRFECIYRHNVKDIATLYRIVIMDAKRMLAMGFWLIICLAPFVITLPTISFIIKAIIIGLCGLIAYYFWAPYYYAKRAIKQIRKILDEESPQTLIRFYDNEIEASEGRNTQYLNYSQITQLRSTKKFWFLMIDKKIALPISKEEFTQGNATLFLAFIREKCPQAKGIDKL